MFEQLTITCPHCSFSKAIPKGAIPEGTRQATCPGCKQSFPLAVESGGLSHHSASLGALLSPLVRAADGSCALPPQTPPAAAQQPPRPRTFGFAFNGSARDYFGIWIVNSLLKLLTIGIYSAWAKV